VSILISVFLGGGFGAIIRYLVIEQVNKLFLVAFPFGTIAVNVIGAFLIGLLSSYLAERLDVSENIKMFLIVGFCGGFTTFSSFNIEFYQLFSNGEILSSLIYVTTTFVLTVVAFYVGVSLLKLI
tara:strand:- start:627 stop:1001 length:375 start_codon:yes stop_codon:yes gene_type:complete